MRAGNLRNQIDIQQKVAGSPSVNSMNEPDDGFVSFHQCWADIRAVNGKEQTANEAPESLVDTEIRIRHKAGITAAMRVVHGATIYDIRVVDYFMQKNREIILRCTRGNSLG